MDVSVKWCCSSIGHTSVVSTVGGHCTAIHLLQICQRVTDHVPWIVYSSSAKQSRPFLWIGFDTLPLSTYTHQGSFEHNLNSLHTPYCFKLMRLVSSSTTFSFCFFVLKMSRKWRITRLVIRFLSSNLFYANCILSLSSLADRHGAAHATSAGTVCGVVSSISATVYLHLVIHWQQQAIRQYSTLDHSIMDVNISIFSTSLMYMCN